MSPASKGLRSPVPSAKKDDLEDVAWALSTAEAMWSRGEHSDSLKWIRRAAEAASEAEADDRALELAKAAADVASLLADRPTAIGAPPVAHVPPAPLAPVAQPPPLITTTSKPPPPMSVRHPPPPMAAGTGQGAPAAPRVAGPPALPRPGQKGPTPPRIASPPVSRRGGRRSSPSFTEEMEPTRPHPIASGPTGAAVATGSRRASVTNERKRARTSKPAPEETMQGPPIPAPSPVPGPPQTVRGGPVNTSEDTENWPTQSIVDDDDDEVNHTRIGTPAYTETAQRASARPPAIPQLAPLVTTQAVRVVVWRGPDGVHVAPAGTKVAAIAVEAVLVAIDPGADLAAWLSNK